VDPLGDGVAVHGAAHEGFEDEQFQGSLDEVAGLGCLFPNHLRGRLFELVSVVNWRKPEHISVWWRILPHSGEVWSVKCDVCP